MNLHGQYAGYILAAYGVSLVLLGGAALGAWREWRRVQGAWTRLNGRGGRGQ